MIFSILGVASALLFIIADTPYLLDTIAKKTKPHRVTWMVIFFLNCVVFANQLASGARNSLWIMGAAVLMTGAIALASIHNGVGGSTRNDHFAVIASVVGILLWVYFKDPFISAVISVIISWIALSPTFAKALQDPESETRITWLLATISAFLAFVSVGELNYKLMLLPLNAVVLQSVMVYILYIRPRHETLVSQQ